MRTNWGVGAGRNGDSKQVNERDIRRQGQIKEGEGGGKEGVSG